MVLDVAVAAAELEEGPALTALDALLGAALLAPTDVPRRYRFRHPLVRRAVYDTTAEGWRLGAHARAAQALEDHGGTACCPRAPSGLCAQPADAAAIRVLVEAGASAAPRAPATAAAWYSAALRLLPEGSETAGEGWGCSWRWPSVRPPPAMDVGAGGIGSSTGLAGGDDGLASLRSRLVAGCAMCENLLGRHEAAHGRRAAALEDVTDPRSVVAADLQVEWPGRRRTV